jgi:hypothetical protein
MGIRAFRRTWRTMVTHSLAPLARTVLIKSWRKISSTEERVIRITEPDILAPRIRAGRAMISRFFPGSAKNPT